jgi:toxin ParE1/3/4
MPSYALTQAAENDLADIAAYTVKTFGVAQAIVYRDGLIRAFEFLAENPGAVRLRTELKPPLRAHRFQSHLIVYDLLPDEGILIVRDRHGREDWQVRTDD